MEGGRERYGVMGVRKVCFFYGMSVYEGDGGEERGV